MLRLSKKTKLILLISLIIVFLVIISLSITFAIWQKEESAAIEINIEEPNVEKWNDSLDYIIFMPLNSIGEPLKNNVDFENCYSLAVVGYDGVFSYLEIPEKITFTYQNEEYEKAITAALLPDEESIFFRSGKVYESEELNKNILMQNEVIEKIFFPHSINKIEAVFQSIPNLQAITMDGQENIDVREYAFSGCLDLESVITERTFLVVNENQLKNIFLNTKVDISEIPNSLD